MCSTRHARFTAKQCNESGYVVTDNEGDADRACGLLREAGQKASP